MSVGALTAKIVLDNPKHIYCGTEEAVTGHVAVRYLSHSTTELFGPLVVSISFRGRAKTKIYKNNGNNRTIYRGRAPLFAFSKQVFNGPVKFLASETQQFPFSLDFPGAVQQMTTQGHWDPDARFSMDVGDPLPPTFNIVYHGFAHRFDAFTEYRIGTTLEMRGIDVKLPSPDEEANSHLVPYEQPTFPLSQALPVPKLLTQGVRLQNALLLPENSRPSGFKQKTKALLSSDYYPEFHFDVLTTCPQKLYLGQPITLEIRVQVNDSRSTAPVRPDITTSTVSIAIQAQTIARAERSFLSTPESSGSDTVLSLTASSPDLAEPFGKANDYTKVVSTKPLFGIPSGFATYNIVRRYTMQVTFHVTAAGKATKVEKTLPIMVLPPVLGEEVNGGLSTGTAVPGPSTSAAMGKDDGEALPGYERPPEYGDDNSALEGDVAKMSLGKGKANAVAALR